jgi:hypothetical protein
MQGEKPCFPVRPDLMDLQFVFFFNQIDSHKVAFDEKMRYPDWERGTLFFHPKTYLSCMNKKSRHQWRRGIHRVDGLLFSHQSRELTKRKVSGTPGLFLLPGSRPSSVGGLCMKVRLMSVE